MNRTCEICNGPLASNVKAERITGICDDCQKAYPDVFEASWAAYQCESDETVEANSK